MTTLEPTNRRVPGRGFKTFATQPVKVVELFGGQIASQLLIVIALGAGLHAFNAYLSRCQHW